ncbi:MAG: YifB family Mg chelatase-like AAA ATPase [Hungatella sp.]|nr:YifB family Mg chelatase-like AAA ATPase [Hungatella sp.]
MFSKVNSIGLRGLEGYPVSVEVDAGDGLPGVTMVGALAGEVREAQDRVRTALKNSGYRFRPRKVTINLSPADIRKGGTGFDFPIAVGMLCAYEIADPRKLEDAALIGELGLDGELKPVKGVLSLVCEARDQGLNRCFLPSKNAGEGRAVGGIRIIGISSIREMAEYMENPDLFKEEKEAGEECEEDDGEYPVDYREVQGQLLMKRAAEVAVAGSHNLLYIGPAGTGKTMVAERIPTIMPPCTRQEQLEISKVYSVCGLLPQEGKLLRRRPFRSPHHSITGAALAGGGRNPVPGELSLASGGVLFLDEFPEFSRYAIEMMRQPLESGRVVMSRVSGRYEFPARFILVAAMNPCPCGFYPDRNRCRCTRQQVRNYLSRISGPILDRIDICAEASPITFSELRQSVPQETSLDIRRRVERARKIQERRYAGTGIRFNSQMKGEHIRRYCALKKEDEQFFQAVYRNMNLSARAYTRILKVARTIADLDGQERIGHGHLCESVSYRSLEEKYWNS